jgi:hypothetical protein
VIKTNLISYITLAISIIALLLGPGIVWKYQELKIERIKKTSEMYKQLDDIYIKIIDLNSEWNELYKKEKEVPSDEFYKKITLLKAKLELNKSNFMAIEKNLALLEGRPPRNITLEFFVPSMPSGLRVVE